MSDKVQHLVDGFKHYGDFVEDYINKGQFNFAILFSLQHCLHMVKLALHRSQHGEFWDSQTRQQQNFESIQLYTERMNDVLKSFQRVVQNSSCSMSAPFPLPIALSNPAILLIEMVMMIKRPPPPPVVSMIMSQLQCYPAQ